ncbi:hypothetical protein COV93_02695 [Candidatus Woesearchaeota archaeon CG11_big_fil_rev_8_21_14_0_20_43_8]|nr:MAG: hypothetical protein COV93_02695 [Candidatus Woesearchaeota archaeon CG11_big_fil_rev_8_21_14_0_20_43_8]PIO07090.1 MAG: hypothetical protein COT47_01550 [Candidatus Woesearchaeota archaeon CG08_land_8_20_14_0_20_43_7]
MRIGVTSESKIKLDAVRTVFPGDTILGYKTNSKVGEQPVGHDTINGALNRALDLESKTKDPHLSLSGIPRQKYIEASLDLLWRSFSDNPGISE